MMAARLVARGGLTRALTASACVLVLAACGNDDGGAKADPSPSATDATPSESSASSGSPGEGRTVDAPGELTDPLRSADIMVVSLEAKPLPESLIAAVKKVKGVVATELIDLGSVSIQNSVATVASVDPASYRRFTASGQSSEIWNRVAGGELALSQELAKEVADDEAYVRMGNDKDAPKIHVGAYADQVPNVDMVLNRAWTDDLGLVSDNALVISTGAASPQRVRTSLKGLVDDVASIQMLDVVARFGLDPNAKQTAYLTGGSVAQAVGSFTYSVLGDGRIAPDPAWVKANIRTEQVPIIGSVTCHRVVLPQLRAALTEVVERGLSDKIHPGEYAGCYYPRFIANSNKLSLHSFGIALDFNVPGNQRGTAGEIDRTVVSIFKKWGFAWGGDWKWTDPMHFEMNALVEPR
ncbi:M15 family metallopeptidase [Nocardioides dubius]|uniref:Peptidase M15C domain-containing protein n=1 Tax=Nocardioides dubius TaxID=317019 RepID=A0ABN1TUC5_9ACTN